MDFYEHLKNYLNEEEIALLKDSLSLENKHAAILNLRKMDDEKFLSLYPDVTPHPIVPHAYIYDKKQYDLGKSIYHELGCFYLQEPSAMLPSYFLSPKPGETILDLCAAPGGKSVQASFLMNNKGMIISNDLSRSRCSAILENVERLGIGNITITNNDFSKVYHKYNSYFDRIILDAPCSGSGMFRKDDKMMLDWSYNKVIKFQEIQKELILYSYSMLKEGGIMVYSTCSFSKEEDEDVIHYLLDNSNAEIIDIEKSPLFYINKKDPIGIHLLPYLFPGEGHYICLVKKPGTLVVKEENKKKEKSSIYNLLIKNACMHTEKYGDYLFGYDKEVRLEGLNIIRKGVKIGQIFNKDVKFDYHFSRFIDKYTPYFDLENTELEKFYRGETIAKKVDKGFIMVRFDGINIVITKSDGNIIKNSLPKGLRKNLNK